jgi:aspartokinase
MISAETAYILAGMPNNDIVVMKFGGTSVADAERIKRAARRIVDKRDGADDLRRPGPA